MTNKELTGRTTLWLIALGVMFLAGYGLGKHVADKWWEHLIATASPFAPAKLTPVTRFVVQEGNTLDCVFDNEGNRGDLVIWDAEYLGKKGVPSKTCHAIKARIIGELTNDTPAQEVGNIQFYIDRKRDLQPQQGSSVKETN